MQPSRLLVYARTQQRKPFRGNLHHQRQAITSPALGARQFVSITSARVFKDPSCERCRGSRPANVVAGLRRECRTLRSGLKQSCTKSSNEDVLGSITKQASAIASALDARSHTLHPVGPGEIATRAAASRAQRSDAHPFLPGWLMSQKPTRSVSPTNLLSTRPRFPTSTAHGSGDREACARGRFPRPSSRC